MDSSTKGILCRPPTEAPKDPVIRESLPGAPKPSRPGSRESADPPATSPPIPDEKPKDILDMPIIQMPLEVKTCNYYHGTIPRVDAEASLQLVGDFLLRKAELNQGGYHLVISVKRDGGFVHAPLNQDKEGSRQYYFVPGIKENNVLELVDGHILRGQSVSPMSTAIPRKPVNRSTWIVRHEDVILYKKIGAGAFGEVFLARMVDPTSEYVLDCAVKTMKQDASIDAKLRFMKEARMMRKSYKHKHVVMMFGIATLNMPLLIIMELCPNGSLISHLRKNKGKISVFEKLRFITEASSGLAYLESMNCIHRDVAARNCLLSAKNEIKISDFGLADDKGAVIDFSLDKLPIKWLAPETMQDKIYSSKSDIWAFGILVWEIFADGDEPYPGLNNVQARAKIVVHDYRMKFPDETPPEVIQVISTCWNKNPDQRGTMGVHAQALLQIFEIKGPLLAVAPAQTTLLPNPQPQPIPATVIPGQATAPMSTLSPAPTPTPTPTTPDGGMPPGIPNNTTSPPVSDNCDNSLYKKE